MCLALVLAEHVWVYSGAFRDFPFLSGFSLPGLILLSPLFYCYALALLQETLGRRVALHFLPSLCILLTVLPWSLVEGDAKVEWLEISITSGLPFFSTHATLVVTAISSHMLAYFYATYLLVEKYESQVKEGSSDPAVLSIHWLTQLSFGFCLFAVLFYLTALGFLIMTSSSRVLPELFVYGIAGFIFFMTLLSYRQPDLFAEYQPGKLPSVEELEERPKYQNTMLPPELLKEYKDLLLVKMEEDKPYLDGELRIGNLAASMDIPGHQLSQVINVAFEVSFFDFINQYRVSYAKSLMSAGSESGNILDIALQSGFNSKASFNRVFKREAGTTPTEFLASQSKSEKKPV